MLECSLQGKFANIEFISWQCGMKWRDKGSRNRFLFVCKAKSAAIVLCCFVFYSFTLFSHYTAACPWALGQAVPLVHVCAWKNVFVLVFSPKVSTQALLYPLGAQAHLSLGMNLLGHFETFFCIPLALKHTFPLTWIYWAALKTSLQPCKPWNFMASRSCTSDHLWWAAFSFPLLQMVTTFYIYFKVVEADAHSQAYMDLHLHQDIILCKTPAPS